MRFFIVFAFLIFMYSPQALAQEPVPNDSCSGYPEGSYMISGGPELGGVVHELSCLLGFWSTYTPPDTTPVAFINFTDETGVAVATVIASNSLTISGINTATAVTITGDGTPEFRINGGTWGTTGNITDGQTLELRLTSNAANSTMNSATVTVGTVSDQWDVMVVFMLA
jgi:hypothetical protein